MPTSSSSLFCPLQASLQHNCLPHVRRIHLYKFKADRIEDLMELLDRLLLAANHHEIQVKPIKLHRDPNGHAAGHQHIAYYEARVRTHGRHGLLEDLDADRVVEVVEQTAVEVNVCIWS